MKKKEILLGSWLVAIVLLLISKVGTFSLCDGNYSCAHALANILRSLIPLLALAPLSLIFYFLRDEVFKAWVKFALWWIPLSIVLSYLTPENNELFPTGPGVTAYILSALFVLISLIIVLVKSLSLRKQGGGV